MAGTISNLLTTPHPGWMWIGAVTVAVAAWFGAVLSERKGKRAVNTQ
jgi:hypothetical protein